MVRQIELFPEVHFIMDVIFPSSFHRPSQLVYSYFGSQRVDPEILGKHVDIVE